MPRPRKGPRLGKSPSHERKILANLASSIIMEGQVTTTLAKAKAVRPLTEKMITKAKRGDLHARRLDVAHRGGDSVVVGGIGRARRAPHRLLGEMGGRVAGTGVVVDIGLARHP